MFALQAEDTRWMWHLQSDNFRSIDDAVRYYGPRHPARKDTRTWSVTNNFKINRKITINNCFVFLDTVQRSTIFSPIVLFTRAVLCTTSFCRFTTQKLWGNKTKAVVWEDTPFQITHVQNILYNIYKRLTTGQFVRQPSLFWSRRFNIDKMKPPIQAICDNASIPSKKGGHETLHHWRCAGGKGHIH